MNEIKKIVNVPTEIPPTRLDNYLVTTGLGLSRTQIQKLIRDKKIAIAGKGIKPAFILAGGEEIHISIPEDETLRLIPEDIPLKIIYEDDRLLVIDKPAGMVVHPARGHFTGTLIHAVLFHSGKLSSLGGETRPGVVHRLDKDTSGLIMVALDDPTHAFLAKELSAHKIKREYYGIVWGRMPQKSGSIEGNIGHNPKDHRKMAVDQRGKPARTDYEVIANYGIATLVKFRLHTGRTHQIRVHTSFINRPILGDPDYGGREERLHGIMHESRIFAKKLLEQMPRQALHAKKLTFIHPFTKEEITVECDLPEDFTRVIETLVKGEF
jgi:23S rRNA pseudouridine1911/1915/1917 synthase